MAEVALWGTVFARTHMALRVASDAVCARHADPWRSARRWVVMLLALAP